VSSSQKVWPSAVRASPLQALLSEIVLPELSPVLVLLFCLSRLHFPVPLRSTRITGFHHYYGDSDSCAVGNALVAYSTWHAISLLLAAAQVSSFNPHNLPGSPSPTTPPLPRSLSHPSNQRRKLAAFAALGFAIPSVAHQPVKAESSSSSYGLPVRLPLLPTQPRGYAVMVSYRTDTGLPEEDSHLSDYVSARAHDGRIKSDHDDMRAGSISPADESDMNSLRQRRSSLLG
jgi:hypothetical protein